MFFITKSNAGLNFVLSGVMLMVWMIVVEVSVHNVTDPSTEGGLTMQFSTVFGDMAETSACLKPEEHGGIGSNEDILGLRLFIIEDGLVGFERRLRQSGKVTEFDTAVSI